MPAAPARSQGAASLAGFAGRASACRLLPHRRRLRSGKRPCLPRAFFTRLPGKPMTSASPPRYSLSTKREGWRPADGDRSQTMKRVLVVHFSQTGQLARIVSRLIAPLAGEVELVEEVLRPRAAYPFP